MTTFPYGYAGSPQGMGTQLTIAQYEQQRTIRQLNFEFWRRTKALMEFAATQGIPLGVGTGWRIQPGSKPGFASPGNSNHEGFPADGVSGGAVAADMVPSTSWGWMQGQVGRFGLRTFQFVNNEPWHIQPSDIPASRNYRREPWVLNAWPLPGTGNPLDYNPALHHYSLFPLADKPDLHWLDGWPGSPTESIRHIITYFNDVVNYEAGQKVRDPHWLFTDDQYDRPDTPVSEQGSINALRALNNFFNPNGANADLRFEAYVGVCGKASWKLIDAIATNFGHPR